MNEQRVKNSYEKINYLLRPRKQIERKIFIEILQELDKTIKLQNYHYIGMGSIFYYDFILFHKYLRLKSFVSLDDKDTKKRFDFNKPYDFIEFKNMKTTEYLHAFEWDKKVIIWLDYDTKYSDLENILSDIAIITKNCNKHDILLFTINGECPPKPRPGEKIDERLEFYNKFEQYMSTGYHHNKYVSPKYFIKLLRDICMNYIKKQEAWRDIHFQQFIFFKYQDGAEMLTLGGIYDENERIIKKLKNTNHLKKFISVEGEEIEIDVPILTYCEKAYLDSNLMSLNETIQKINKLTKRIPEKDKIKARTELINDRLQFELNSYKDLEAYLLYYKYYPQYYEGIL